MKKLSELFDGVKTLLGVLFIVASFFRPNQAEALRGVGLFLIGYGGREKIYKYKQGGAKEALKIKTLKRGA